MPEAIVETAALEGMSPRVDDRTVELSARMLGSAPQLVEILKATASIARSVLDARRSVAHPMPMRTTAKALGALARASTDSSTVTLFDSRPSSSWAGSPSGASITTATTGGRFSTWIWTAISSATFA